MSKTKARLIDVPRYHEDLALVSVSIIVLYNSTSMVYCNGVVFLNSAKKFIQSGSYLSSTSLALLSNRTVNGYRYL